MKSILITGFTPFDGEVINPSYEAISHVRDEIMGYKIIKKEIETSFSNSHVQLFSFIDEIKPYAIILVGQAGGSKHIRVERIAINVDDAHIQDNLGAMPQDKIIIKSAYPAYFSTLPLKFIVENLLDEGIPAAISNAAGTFVCNHLFFHMLHYLKQHKSNMPAGFIHVPYIYNQVIDKPGVYATDLHTLTHAIEVIIETVIKESLWKIILS